MSEREKSAADCESLEEVRAQIDRIDRLVVALLAERGAYVLRVASFKKSHAEVAAPQRAEEVVRKAKGLAAELGANPVVIERVYREMIAAFIEAEMAEISGRPAAVQNHSEGLSAVAENA